MLNKKLNYVVTRTPLRVSFLGGGTDMPYFYKTYGGATLSTAINKFVYVTVKRHTSYFNEIYRLNYFESENCRDLNQIKNLIIRETIKHLKINDPLYISVISDIPVGSGLGGSSSFIVGLIKALTTLDGIKKTKKEIFDLATHIELDVIKSPIGKQDHIPAVYGGLLYSRYLKNGEIKIKKISNLNFLKNLFIIWTGKTRFSEIILNDQKKNFKKNIIFLNKMNYLTKDFYSKLINKQINLQTELINAVKKSWYLKKKFTKLISNKKINKIINFATSKKIGAKLLGAGGGGFILLFGLSKYRYNFLDYKLDSITPVKNGTEIILKI